MLPSCDPTNPAQLRKQLIINGAGEGDRTLVYIPFKKHVSEVKPRLAAELQEAGFQINIKDMLAS